MHTCILAGTLCAHELIISIAKHIFKNNYCEFNIELYVKKNTFLRGTEVNLNLNTYQHLL